MGRLITAGACTGAAQANRLLFIMSEPKMCSRACGLCVAVTCSATRTSYDSRPYYSIPRAMGLGDGLAHSAARLHSRTSFIYRCARRPLFFYRSRNLVPHIWILDQDIRRLIWDGCRFWDYHAFPVRHELEPFQRCRWRRGFAIAGVRGFDGLLSGGLVSWGSFVWAKTGADLGSFFRGAHGRVRNAAVLVLDSSDELMDANAAGLQTRRRTFRAGRLVRDCLQSILSLSIVA